MTEVLNGVPTLLKERFGSQGRNLKILVPEVKLTVWHRRTESEKDTLVIRLVTRRLTHFSELMSITDQILSVLIKFRNYSKSDMT